MDMYMKGRVKLLFGLLVAAFLIGRIYCSTLGVFVYNNVTIKKVMKNPVPFSRDKIVYTSRGVFKHSSVYYNDQTMYKFNEVELIKGGKCRLKVQGIKSNIFFTKPHIVNVKCEYQYKY